MQLSNKMDSNITTELVASSPSPSTNSWKYDVFLSFRGGDTRNRFTDHLHRSLLRRGINTFMDDDQLERGQDMSREVYQAIKESKISIILLSQNYASSTWCLEELAKIIEFKNSQHQIVIPVYFNVDPADVKKQMGAIGEAFAHHEIRFKENLEMVERWRAALKDAANLPGLNFNNYERESKFIHEITEIILHNLNRVYLTYEMNYPVGIDSRIREINDLLGDGITDVRMVGIWGTGGIGKTTLAKAVYNSVAHKFEGSCFLGNVRENSEAPGGLVQLQKTLLHNILGLKRSRVDIIKSELSNKRVLLIIDDVDDLNQLKCLAGSSDWFGAGSRIIITTRDQHLLRAHGVEFTYQVKELESDEALELFSSNAFPTSRLPDDYQLLARRFVGYAQGNPLALTATGLLLYRKSIDEWHSILERYERAPASNIHEILKITKKELDHHIKRLEENVLTNVEEHAGGLYEAESNELMLEQNDTISGTPEVERLRGKISETYNEVTGLNEVENTAKLLGVETFSSTQEEERIQGRVNRTDDVTEQNEDENNVNLVEGDKTFSSIQEEDLLGKTPGTDDALNKVENTEKLVEGDQTFSSTQEEDRLEGKIQGTDYITGQNEDENTEQLVEGDKTFSSSQEEDLLLQGKTPGTDDALYKAETTEKLVDGDETFSSTQEEDRLQGKIQGTDDITEPNEAEGTSTQVVETVEAKILGTEDVTEQNEDENNVNLVEGDKTFSSIQEEDLLGKTPGTDDALNKVENTEKLVEGDQTFSSTQEEDRLEGKIQGTDYITEPNEAESTSTQVVETVEAKILGTEDVTGVPIEAASTNCLIEGDETFSSTLEVETLHAKIPETEDVTGITEATSVEKFLDTVERLHDKIPGSDDDITLIEGVNTDSEDVTGENATEGTEGFPGRDETSSDTKKLEKLRIQIDDVTQPKPKANVVENTCWSTTIKSFLLEADTGEWIFLILSFFLEILAAICDQFYSPGNSYFALTGMWLASVALFFCVCELILKCKQGESSSPRLKIFPDIFGLICGISQWLSTIARLVCTLKGKENPFKVNLLPVIFLGCWGGRKLIANNKRCKTENRIEFEPNSIDLEKN